MPLLQKTQRDIENTKRKIEYHESQIIEEQNKLRTNLSPTEKNHSKSKVSHYGKEIQRLNLVLSELLHTLRDIEQNQGN